ncbi:hypothetical protein [Bacillus sp. Marseille-P3661]|uniref:hypothetical protein n=1 Tax=Bacillus sp. Marseille-P3661 TaxID=1936234 RepID=UPI000C83551D|nr:hypothetical protein [Bacillus sp. Marseille-P3661]
MFQQAVWLAKKDLKYQWAAMFLTVVSTMFFGVLAAVLLEQSTRKMFGAEMMYYNWILLDVVFVVMTISLGAIYMSGPYLSFKTIKEDPYSRRMALLRSLPIPLPVLSLSRTIVMVVTLVVLSVVFYTTITVALSHQFFQYLTPAEYMTFILFWFGCSLALGGFTPFIEYGTSGKILHMTPIIFLVVFFIVVSSFYKLVGSGVVEFILVAVKNIGWPLAIISLLVGILGCYCWNKILTFRLATRDYL